MGAVKLLLDTHVLLWWLFDDPQLSTRVRSRIKNPENRIFVSSASAWEISTKHRLGKLPEATGVSERLQALVLESRMEPLSITLPHALLAGHLSVSHKDPFDRMLAAQSQLEGLPLAASDPAFAQFAVEVVW